MSLLKKSQLKKKKKAITPSLLKQKSCPIKKKNKSKDPINLIQSCPVIKKNKNQSCSVNKIKKKYRKPRK